MRESVEIAHAHMALLESLYVRIPLSRNAIDSRSESKQRPIAVNSKGGSPQANMTFENRYRTTDIRRLLLIGVMLGALCFQSACGPLRPPVPPGVVPEQTFVPAEDEQYGHEVLNGLTENFKLDNDDARINRVRDIVDRLTQAAKAGHNPWHVYVLNDSSVKNAAATRGNFVFVWTGMLEVVQNDSELAAILAHEISHVLAGHTQPNPAEETRQILSEVAGSATGQILANQGLAYPLSNIAEALVKASFEAFLVNPGSQRNELEADQIGLFMMADAGYNPEEAVNFWDRVKSLPEFSTSLEFFSTHPSSEERVKALQGVLGDALERFHTWQSTQNPKQKQNQQKDKAPTSQKPKAGRDTFVFAKHPVEIHVDAKSDVAPPRKQPKHDDSIWSVQERSTAIHSSADKGSSVLSTLSYSDRVTVSGREGRWLHISAPTEGYVFGPHLAPIE